LIEEKWMSCLASMAVKERIRKAKDNRSRELKAALAMAGFRMNRTTPEIVTYAKDFIRGGWRPRELRQPGKRFWTMAEIVQLYRDDRR
jgi:hypothetical protein